MPHFVTSRQENDHVTSANAAHLTAGLLGNGCYVLPVGQKLACTMTDSNTLRVLFGVASVCGRQWEIEGDYEEVNIDNGVPGYNRTDLLVCRIETAPQETIALKVYKGEETTGTPVVPGHVEGDLNDGDTVCEMPICSVRVNGINPQEPVSLVKESKTIAEMHAEIIDIWDSLSQIEHIEIAAGIHGYRFGRIAIVTWYISKQFTPNAFTELATLPASMRPPLDMYFPVELTDSSARAFINTKGRFTIYSFTTASQSQGTIAFPIA